MEAAAPLLVRRFSRPTTPAELSGWSSIATDEGSLEAYTWYPNSRRFPSSASGSDGEPFAMSPDHLWLTRVFGSHLLHEEARSGSGAETQSQRPSGAQRFLTDGSQCPANATGDNAELHASRHGWSSVELLPTSRLLGAEGWANKTSGNLVNPDVDELIAAISMAVVHEVESPSPPYHASVAWQGRFLPCAVVAAKLWKVFEEVGKLDFYCGYSTAHTKPIDVQSWLEQLYVATRYSQECFVIAIVYVDRALNNPYGLRLDATVWRPLLFAAFLVAHKYWDDDYIGNRDFVVGYPGHTYLEANMLEHAFLAFLGYRTFVDPSVYARGYFGLRAAAKVVKEAIDGPYGSPPSSPISERLSSRQTNNAEKIVEFHRCVVKILCGHRQPSGAPTGRQSISAEASYEVTGQTQRQGRSSSWTKQIKASGTLMKRALLPIRKYRAGSTGIAGNGGPADIPTGWPWIHYGIPSLFHCFFTPNGLLESSPSVQCRPADVATIRRQSSRRSSGPRPTVNAVPSKRTRQQACSQRQDANPDSSTAAQPSSQDGVRQSGRCQDGSCQEGNGSPSDCSWSSTIGCPLGRRKSLSFESLVSLRRAFQLSGPDSQPHVIGLEPASPSEDLTPASPEKLSAQIPRHLRPNYQLDASQEISWWGGWSSDVPPSISPEARIYLSGADSWDAMVDMLPEAIQCREGAQAPQTYLEQMQVWEELW